MFPVIRLGPLELPSYFLMLTIGYLFAAFLAFRDSDRQGIPRNRAVDLVIVLFIAGIIGARLLSVVADGYFMDYVHLCTSPKLVQPEKLPGNRLCVTDSQCKSAHKGGLCDTDTGLCHPERDCLRAFKFWYGGLTFYGGIILALLAGFWYIRHFKLPMLKILDISGWAIALGLGFGRIGCLLAGCCFGLPCKGQGYCLTFPRGSPAWEHQVNELHTLTASATHSLPVYPTQPLHSISNFLIFAFLYFYLRRRHRFDGQIFYAFLMLYSVSRFVIEFIRGDPRGGMMGLATSQLVGIPVFLLALGLYILAGRKNKVE